MAATQAHRLVSFTSPLGEDVLLLSRMIGREQLGRLFEYEVEVHSENEQVNFSDLLGENVTLRLELQQAEGTRYFNGYVSDVAQGASVGRYATYVLTVRPWLWFLTRTSDCRIFQNQTVPEIIRQVFEDHGFSDFELRLNGSYRQWEYFVQYRETDFDFVSRAMEQEGIYYFFVHESGKHILVLADGYSSHDTFPGYEEIPFFHPDPQRDLQRDHVHALTINQRVQPGSVALNDFDPEVPKKNLRNVTAIPRDHAQSQFEMYDYPGEYVETGDGESYTRIRIEEIQAQHETGQGEGNARGLKPGFLFTLDGAPREDSNREFLTIEARYEITSDDYETGGETGDAPLFLCQFTVIDAQTPYRSPRITPQPVIQGPQTAIVVGPAGEEIWTDELGRVKCHFHWDRYSKADETSSLWIRVAQIWAGKRWGSMHIPRIGQEVIVEFLEGNPNRPIVTGRVYNGENKPPYELPANKTLSGTKSNSSKGGQGFNELRFEDKKGEEQIFLHAEKNYDIRVKNDRFEWIGNDRHLIVKTDKFEHVENNRHEQVDADHHEKISGDRHLTVEGKQAIKVTGSQSFTVTGNVTEAFQADHKEQVSGSFGLKASSGMVLECPAGITLKCGGSSVVIDPSGVTIKGPMIVLDGQMVRINSGPGSPPMPFVPGQAVTPAGPEQAEEADNADPGEIAEIKAEQAAKKSGKYGSAPITPFKPAPPGSSSNGGPDDGDDEDEQRHWIEIVLKDEEGNPVPGERYEIIMPDGSVKKGTLDQDGFARVDGIEDPGNCEITFPDLDREAWERG